MNLRAKIYVENQKKRTQEKLDVRLALLKEKGIKDEAIQKDATVRQLKAEVRKADYRLAAIASRNTGYAGSLLNNVHASAFIPLRDEPLTGSHGVLTHTVQ